MMPTLLPAVIEKLQHLSPDDLQKVLRFLDTLASAREELPAPVGPNARPVYPSPKGESSSDEEDLDEGARPWRGVFAVESPRRDETPLPLSPAEPLPPREQLFDILWDPNRHDD